MAESQFETGKMDNYKRDFQRTGTYRSYSSDFSKRSKKFEFRNTVETSENNDGFVIKIPLSEITIENLKIIPEKNYIIVQSNKKTIFIELNHQIKPETISSEIKTNFLIISIKK